MAIGFFRKGLIAGQFVASILMIIGTLVIGQQLNFLRKKNLGYNREHVVIIPTNKSRKEGNPLAERFKSELTKDPQVIGSAVSLFSFTEPGWVNLGYEDDKKVYRNLRMNAIDADFVNTMNLQVVKGRNFSKDNPADISSSMVVNEALVKEYGWDDPIGKKLPGPYEQQVIGVVKDFHFESLHNIIQPLMLVLKPDSVLRRSSDVGFSFAGQPRVNVRLKAGNIQDQIASLKKHGKQLPVTRILNIISWMNRSTACIGKSKGSEQLFATPRFYPFLSPAWDCLDLLRWLLPVEQKRLASGKCWVRISGDW